MCAERKPLVWLKGEVKSPPFSKEARLEAGHLLGRLQDGELIGMPHSRPMPSIGPRCHELRVRDEGHYWRIFYRVDPDAIPIMGVVPKGTRATPKHVIDECKDRLKRYDAVRKAARKAAREGGGT
jgi:phage-related protein